MNESQIQTLAQEIGDVLKRLERFRGDVERLGSGVADVQESVQDLVGQVRLVAEAGRLGLTAGGAEPAAQPEEEPAPGTDRALAADGSASEAVPEWFASFWHSLVAQVNARLAAVGPSAVADPASSVQAITQFRMERLEPLRQWTGPVNRHFMKMESDRELKPAADRYVAVRKQMDRIHGQALAWEKEFADTQVWSGEVDLPALHADDLIKTVAVDGQEVPQIDLAPVLLTLAEAANRQMKTYCAARLEGPRPAGLIEERVAQLDHELADLLGKFMDLKHSLAEAVLRKEQSGGLGADGARSLIQSLTAKLRELEIEEIEIGSGDRVNSRLHRVVAREPDARYGEGRIIRVVVPGYRYRSEVVRLAQVVATP